MLSVCCSFEMAATATAAVKAIGNCNCNGIVCFVDINPNKKKSMISCECIQCQCLEDAFFLHSFSNVSFLGSFAFSLECSAKR